MVKERRGEGCRGVGRLLWRRESRGSMWVSMPCHETYWRKNSSLLIDYVAWWA